MEQIEKALARARQMRTERGDRPAETSAQGPRADRFGRNQDNVQVEPPAHGATHEYTHTAVAPAELPRSGEHRLVAGLGHHPASDAYRVLRTRVLQRMKQQGYSSLVVTGPTLNSGATTTAANLAIAMALDVNQTVLLVDLNLGAPGIFRKFGLHPTAGVEDYLHGQAKLKDCLVNPGMPRLVILPARNPKGEAAEIITSPRMTALAKELRSRYSDRIIIYDAPPLLASGDTLGFLPNVDAVLLVARSGKTTKAELEKSADLLQKFKVVGTLLNAA